MVSPLPAEPPPSTSTSFSATSSRSAAFSANSPRRLLADLTRMSSFISRSIRARHAAECFWREVPVSIARHPAHPRVYPWVS